MPDLPRLMFLAQAYLNRLVREFEEAQPRQSQLVSEAAQPRSPTDAIVFDLAVPNARSADRPAEAASVDPVQPARTSTSAAVCSIPARHHEQHPPCSAAGQCDPSHQPVVQGQQAAVPCGVTAAPAAAAASEAPPYQIGVLPALAQDLAACSPVQPSDERGSAAAANGSEVGSLKAASADGTSADAASAWPSPVKPVQTALKNHSEPAQAPAAVQRYPAELAPVTPEKHDTALLHDVDVQLPPASVRTRRAAGQSQPVGTRRLSAHRMACAARNGPMAAEQGLLLARQADCGKHARREAARGTSVAVIMPAVGSRPQPQDRKASAACGAELSPGSAETVNAGGQRHAGKRAPSDQVEPSGAEPARVVANCELAKLLCTQPAFELSSLLSCGVTTRRQCAADPPDAAASVSSRQDASKKAAERTLLQPAVQRSKRCRELHSIMMRGASAQRSKKQRLGLHPAAGLVAETSRVPACTARRALRPRRKQADPTTTERSRRSARQQRGVLMVDHLEHGASTRSKLSAATAPTPTSARHSISAAAAATVAGPAESRRTRSQAKACDNNAASVAPSLQTTGLWAEVPQTASHRVASGSRRSAANSTDPRSIAAIAATSGRVWSQRHAAGGSARAEAACGPSEQVTTAHPPATCCEAEPAPPKRVAVKRELALLLRGSGSETVTSGGRADEMPAGLALRNRCVLGRTAVVAKTAVRHTAQQVEGAPATLDAAKSSTEPGTGSQQDDSTAAAQHAALERQEGTATRDNVAVDAARAGAEAEAGTLLPAPLNLGLASQQQKGPPAVSLELLVGPAKQTGALEPGNPAAVVSDSHLSASLRAASASQPDGVLMQAPTTQAKQRLPLPLLPAPPKWGNHGRRSMDVAAAEATARGRTLRAVRPDYARLAATEAAANTRLPVWPGPQMQVQHLRSYEHEILTLLVRDGR